MSKKSDELKQRLGYHVQVHERRCGVCKHYRVVNEPSKYSPHREIIKIVCPMVQGKVTANGLCDLFERREE